MKARHPNQQKVKEQKQSDRIPSRDSIDRNRDWTRYFADSEEPKYVMAPVSLIAHEEIAPDSKQTHQDTRISDFQMPALMKKVK